MRSILIAASLVAALAAPSRAGVAPLDLRSARHETARAPASGTQLYFLPGTGNSIDIFSSGSPNAPVTTITQGLGQSGTIIGADAAGNLYVDVEESDYTFHTVRYAPPYTGAPAVCPNQSVGGAVRGDGTVFEDGPNASLELTTTDGCTPMLQWINPNGTVLAFGNAGKLFASTWPADNSVQGVLAFPAGSTQAVDTLIDMPLTQAVNAMLVDKSGDLVVAQQGSQTLPAQIAIYSPGSRTPKKIFPLQTTGGPHMCFDATRTHLFVFGYSSTVAVEEVTYPGFKPVAAIGNGYHGAGNIAVVPAPPN